jgi:hypothetical protein
MAYILFTKNSENQQGTYCKIVENQTDLNQLNDKLSDYTIIEVSETDFNSVKLNQKNIVSYTGNTVNLTNVTSLFETVADLNNYINNNIKPPIKNYLNNNPNHPQFTKWNNYYNQVSNLQTSTITYPLNKSLEQYFNDLGQTSLNTLQVP